MRHHRPSRHGPGGAVAHSGGAGVTGTIADTVAPPTAVLAGYLGTHGAIASSVTRPTCAMTGLAGAHGTMATTVALPTSAASGVVYFFHFTDTLLASGSDSIPATALSLRRQTWATGGGGATNAGAGGGGAYSEDTITTGAGTTQTVVIGTGGVDTDGGNTTINTTEVVAKGGLSCTNGGTGGAAASGTGTTKYSGGNGALGTGTKSGGGGAGSLGSGSGANAGEPQGGVGASSATEARCLGAGGGSQTSAQAAGARGEARFRYDAQGTPGYARLRQVATQRDTSAATSRAVTMPSIIAGQLIVITVSAASNPTITETDGGWTALAQKTRSGNECAAQVFYKTAAGGDTATIATSSSVLCNIRVDVYSNAGTPEWTTTDGSSATPDPPAHTPSGGSAAYIFVAFITYAASTPRSLNGYPSGYGNTFELPAFSGTSVGRAVAMKLVTGSSENPGAFSLTGTRPWVAGTISIPYAA